MEEQLKDLEMKNSLGGCWEIGFSCQHDSVIQGLSMRTVEFSGWFTQNTVRMSQGSHHTNSHTMFENDGTKIPLNLCFSEETDTGIETLGYSDNLVCSTMIITLLLLKRCPRNHRANANGSRWSLRVIFSSQRNESPPSYVQTEGVSSFPFWIWFFPVNVGNYTSQPHWVCGNPWSFTRRSRKTLKALVPRRLPSSQRHMGRRWGEEWGGDEVIGSCERAKVRVVFGEILINLTSAPNVSNTYCHNIMRKLIRWCEFEWSSDGGDIRYLLEVFCWQNVRDGLRVSLQWNHHYPRLACKECRIPWRLVICLDCPDIFFKPRRIWMSLGLWQGWQYCLGVSRLMSVPIANSSISRRWSGKQISTWTHQCYKGWEVRKKVEVKQGWCSRSNKVTKLFQPTSRLRVCLPRPWWALRAAPVLRMALAFCRLSLPWRCWIGVGGGLDGELSHIAELLAFKWTSWRSSTSY